MKKITFLLLLLATTHMHSTRKSTSVYSIEELLAQQVATKTLQLKKTEEKLQELKECGADPAKIKALKAHMAKRRSSLQLYQAELEALTDLRSQTDSGSTHNKKPKNLARQYATCCKKHYPDLVLGTLYATLACAVAADILKD